MDSTLNGAWIFIRDVSKGAVLVAGKNFKVAVVFNNFGPYHIARLSAAAKYSALLGIEVVQESRDYDWEASATTPFARKTLFQSQECSDFNSRTFYLRLARELSQFEPEVIAIPGWYGLDSFHAMDWARRRGIPVVVMSESQGDDFKRRWSKEWLKTLFLRNCQAALVGGSSHGEYLRRLGMNPDSIWCGYDAVDNSFFEERSDAARADAVALRLKHNLPRPFFLTSARFIEKKNLITLIQAYQRYHHTAELKRPGSSWDLLMVGDGVLRPALEAQVERLALSENVKMPGFQQYRELPLYYGLASVFILPSTTEQWGLVVNEAMASGLPVLVSNRCGCAPDLVEEGRNGYTFDPFDQTNLADLMLRISDDGCDREAMGRVSRKIIAEWSPERFGYNLIQAANRAIGLPRRTSGLIDTLILKLLIARLSWI